MSESKIFLESIQSRIDEFFTLHNRILSSISDDLTPIAHFSRDFLSGGKRFRALFCLKGWQAFHPKAPAELCDCVISAASALEIFHAAALIHDDIIDHSDTRRGALSAHRRFESLHRDSQWTGSSSSFGIGSATLLGDLLLMLSDELFNEALSEAETVQIRRAARHEFNRMRLDVTAGQYLDIVAENSWLQRDESTHVDYARTVIVYKSAKYSIEAPLRIGASLYGASPAHLDAMSAYGLPLGIAFQLRDDLLGVFGDSSVTGKPSGDDLREGKRTMLVSLARERLTANDREQFDDLLGKESLSDDGISILSEMIIQSGAADTVEQLIDENVAQAVAALEDSGINPTVVEQLHDLAVAVTRRSA